MIVKLGNVSELLQNKSTNAKNACLFFFGDRMKLAQVVRNLFSNALKFTPDGGVIEIRGVHDENDFSHIGKLDGDAAGSLLQKGCVTLRVKDSGAGMSEDNLKVAMMQLMCFIIVCC